MIMELDDYYNMKQLQLNLAKTQTRVFQLRNGGAKRKLRIK